MANTIDTRTKTLRLVQLAFLTALVAVLQLLSYYIATPNFSLSLVLLPIMIGGVLLGPGAGAFLGGVFGIVTFIACAAGLDKSGLLLFTISPILTFAICFVKGVLAGLVSSLVYKLMYKLTKKRLLPSVLVASAFTPLVNTLVFYLGMILFFRPTLTEWAGGTDILTFVFLALIGVNFVVEFLINVILCPILSLALSKTKRLRNQF